MSDRHQQKRSTMAANLEAESGRTVEDRVAFALVVQREPYPSVTDDDVAESVKGVRTELVLQEVRVPARS